MITLAPQTPDTDIPPYSSSKWQSHIIHIHSFQDASRYSYHGKSNFVVSSVEDRSRLRKKRKKRCKEKEIKTNNIHINRHDSKSVYTFP